MWLEYPGGQLDVLRPRGDGREGHDGIVTGLGQEAVADPQGVVAELFGFHGQVQQLLHGEVMEKHRGPVVGVKTEIQSGCTGHVVTENVSLRNLSLSPRFVCSDVLLRQLVALATATRRASGRASPETARTRPMTSLNVPGAMSMMAAANTTTRSPISIRSLRAPTTA